MEVHKDFNSLFNYLMEENSRYRRRILTLEEEIEILRSIAVENSKGWFIKSSPKELNILEEMKRTLEYEFGEQKKMFSVLQSIAHIHDDLKTRYFIALEELAEHRVICRKLFKNYHESLGTTPPEQYDLVITSPEQYSVRTASSGQYDGEKISLEQYAIAKTSPEQYSSETIISEQYATGKTSSEPYSSGTTFSEQYGIRKTSPKRYSSRTSSPGQYDATTSTVSWTSQSLASQGDSELYYDDTPTSAVSSQKGSVVIPKKKHLMPRSPLVRTHVTVNPHVTEIDDIPDLGLEMHYTSSNTLEINSRRSWERASKNRNPKRSMAADKKKGKNPLQKGNHPSYRRLT